MDVILRSVIIAILMVIVLGVIARPQPWRWVLCCMAVVLGVSAFVLGNAASQAFAPKFLSWPWAWIIVTFLSKTIVLYVWLFVQCSFDDEFRFDRFRVGASLLWLAVVIHDIWSFKVGIDDPFGYASVIMGLTMMGHLIWTLLRGRDDDLRRGRRTARIWISVIMVSLLLMDIMIDVTMGFSWRPAGFIYVQNGLILLAVLAFAMAIIRIDVSSIAPNAHPKDVPNHQVSDHAATLDQIMRTEQLYLRSDLRLSDVVGRLPISEASTRSLIHDEFGQGHFRSFLNQYRVKHAQELLRSPDHHSRKLIAIAFDSGFASLTSFQRAFKRETGVTASQWRSQARVT